MLSKRSILAQSRGHTALAGGAAPRSVHVAVISGAASSSLKGHRAWAAGLLVGAGRCGGSGSGSSSGSSSTTTRIETCSSSGGGGGSGGFNGGRHKRTGEADDGSSDSDGGGAQPIMHAARLRALLAAAWAVMLLTPSPAAAAAASAEPAALPWGIQGIVASLGGGGGSNSGDERRASSAARRRRQQKQQQQKRQQGRRGGSNGDENELAALCLTMLDLWRPTLANMGVSGAMGALSAAALKAAGRALAAGLGIAFVGLQVLTYTGVATVDWTRVHEAARGVLDATGDGRLDTDAFRGALKRGAVVLSQGLPSTAGFAAGFLLGLRVF